MLDRGSSLGNQAATSDRRPSTPITSTGVVSFNLWSVGADVGDMGTARARVRTSSGRPTALKRAPEDVRRHDRYYMSVAEAVRGSDTDNSPHRDGANCWGSKVGAVIVQGSGPAGERIISTGYNGTPAGFKNCLDGGCVRCEHRRTDPKAGGIGLDRCVCVHAEQNALLTAARFGVSVAGSTIYSTLSPCFNCLKEAIQAGVVRFVYLSPDPPSRRTEVAGQTHEKGLLTWENGS